MQCTLRLRKKACPICRYDLTYALPAAPVTDAEPRGRALLSPSGRLSVLSRSFDRILEQEQARADERFIPNRFLSRSASWLGHESTRLDVEIVQNGDAEVVEPE